MVGLVEPRHPEQARALRDMLSQLQMAYARMGPGTPQEPATAPAPPPAAAPPPAGPGASPGGGDTGPAQRSGRLWIPGQ